MRLDRYTQPDHSGGVQNKTAPNLAQSNQVEHALNADFDGTIGWAIGRKGSDYQSTVETGELLQKMFIHRQGTARHYLTVSEDSSDTNVYKSSTENFAGSWTETLVRTINNDIYLKMFGTKTYAFNGTDTPREYNGSTWAEVSDIPNACLFPEVYGQRLFGLSVDGFLYWSDVIDATGVGFTTADWTNRGVNPNDGQDSKMLVRHRALLYIFKEESIYRYDGTNEPDAVINIGTHSSKSVVRTDKSLFFHYKRTIQKIDGGEPTNISRPVQKYLDGMSTSNWDKTAGGFDGNNVYMWIGDSTISDVTAFDYNTTYTDVVLVFNVWTERWTVYTNWNARVWFTDDEQGETYFGTADGRIIKINAVEFVDDDGTTENPIHFEMRYKGKHYGYPEKRKAIGAIHLLCSNGVRLRAGENPRELIHEGFYDRGINSIVKQVDFNELFVEADAVYTKKPPVVKALIIDNAQLYDTKRDGK